MLLRLGAVIGLIVVAVVVIAALNGRTVDPTIPVNYPHCATASIGQTCQSP